MEAAQFFFRVQNGQMAQHHAEIADKIQGHLAALFKNGQIIGRDPPMITGAGGGYRVFVALPEAAALDDRFASKWVRGELGELGKLGVDAPEVRLIGVDPTCDTACGCQERSFLILFTTFLSPHSPMRCGACFGPIPLYRLPTIGDPENEAGHPENRDDYLSWQARYQAFDTLWMQSGAGERFAQSQLERHDSPLSLEGRALARSLETKAGLPVYYYLTKHYARSDLAENRRRCPSCGGEWRREEPLHEIFDFDCRPCRLLSNIAWGARH